MMTTVEIADWERLPASPVVSVCMITYNHETFIRDALEGILKQEVDFPYEIVVGEDCSTDSTRAILIEYAERYPGKIRLLLRERNLGMMLNFVQTLDACRGEYVALCEGDDYWTCPQKLQTQIDFLDSHRDYSISSHNVFVVQEGSKSPPHEWLGSNAKETLTLEDLLRDGSGGATCSLVFRNRVFGDFPEWYHQQKGGDWSLQVLCASAGKMYYFRTVMGVYRRHEHGAVYAATVAAKAKGEEFIAISSRNSLRICDALNRHFDYRYEKLIQKQKAYWYWVGAVEYSQHGQKGSARVYFLKALPYFPSLPRWLTLRVLLRSLSMAFLPHIFVAFWRSPKSLVKSLLLRL